MAVQGNQGDQDVSAEKGTLGMNQASAPLGRTGRNNSNIAALLLGTALVVQVATGCAQALPSFDGGASTSAGADTAGSSAAGVQSVTAAPSALPTLNGSNNGSNSVVVRRTATVPASTAASSATAPNTVTTTTQPATAGDTGNAGGNVAELQRRIAAKELSELRTTYNGSYGASLLLTNNDPTYYVALFERKNFWRVIKTQNDARAEAIFVDFARQTADLAASEIRTMKLEAQKSAAERLIEVNQQRAAQVQADLAVQQTQQQEVAGRQRDAQAQALALDAENRKTQQQLDQLRRQLADLQRQADEGLPPPTATSTTGGKRR